MLSARAYSFRQKSRLAISLSWIGGYTNVVAFLICGAVASHVTGNVTHFGRLLAEAKRSEAIFMGFMVGAFFSGAVAAAILLEMARRHGIASKYILPLAVEAMLLSVVAMIASRHPAVDTGEVVLMYVVGGLSAFAMGLQNATITKISGAVIRTTHLTGVTTDLGIEGVQYLLWYRDQMRGRKWSRAGRVLKASNRHPSFQRVLLLGSIIGSFVFGAFAGTAIFMWSPGMALLAPVSFLCWIILVDWRKPIADVRELDLMADSELRLLGIMRSLLPPELGIWRVSYRKSSKWHHAPDFTQWADRIPPRWRVVILALSPLTRFDHNAFLDLELALEKLDREGRKLILSGITPAQYQSLMDHGIGKSMDMENLCPDLEFAVARGIDLVQMRHRDPQVTGEPVNPAA